MKNNLCSRLPRWFWMFSLGVALFGAPFARAIVRPSDGLRVIYDPNTVQSVNIDQSQSWSYDVTITSPSALPVGSLTVALKLVVVNAPLLVPTSVSASYVSFSQPTLTFNGPSESRTFRVTVMSPIGSPSGDFEYFITAEGWPTGVVDQGTFINMHATPPSALQPPAVVISNPANGSRYTHTLGGDAIPVNIVTTAQGTSQAPVLGLVTTLSAQDEDGDLLLAPVVLQLSLLGLGTPDSIGRVTVPVDIPGVYTITAVASNVVGTSVTTSTFTVDEFVPPPKVVITEPPQATYDYYVGSPALHIPYEFEGTSFEGGIRTLTATLNGTPVDFEASDIGALLATGTGAFDLSLGGAYVLEVTATDDHGTATASTTFSINVIRPAPAIVINDPVHNSVFVHTTGTPALNIPFTFTTTTNDGFTVNLVSATLDGNPAVISSTDGLNTETAISKGVLAGVAPGIHVLTATGWSAGVQVQTSVSFSVQEISPPVHTPPTVVINTPAENSTYLLSGSCGASVSIPLTFTGASTSPGAVITKLTATVDGRTLTVSSSGLNQKIVNGSANMVITSVGAHSIKVTATDVYGTAVATRTFNVVVSNAKYAIQGTVFFDIDSDGAKDSDDYGLASVSVKLLTSSGSTVATAKTDSSGKYQFTVSPGAYTISVANPVGMRLTTLNNHAINVSSAAVTAPATGYGLNFTAIKTLCANGFTIGYWKNNIEKASGCKSKGSQVSATAIKSYTTLIGKLALSPFNCLTTSNATSILSSTSSRPADLLAKQLLASEYNYANSGFIGGDRALTYAFVYWAEYVLKNSSSYSSSYVIWVKDWCDAYNNSHGGRVAGPSS